MYAVQDKPRIRIASMSSKEANSGALPKENGHSLYKRLCMAFADLLEAHQFLAKLTASEDAISPIAGDEVLQLALRTALVVTYARPFSANRGEDRRRDALPERLLEGLTERQRTVHKDMIRMRDQEYAHLDAMRREGIPM
jgi:hypothetical protein